jgi:hypothetical protein
VPATGAGDVTDPDGTPAANPVLDGPVGAYAAVLDEFWPQGYTGGAILAVDLARVELPDTSALRDLFAEFADASGATLVFADREQLIADGYITGVIDGPGGDPGQFDNGALFTLDDVSLTEDTLTTNASIWTSGLGGHGGTYTATRDPATGTWTLTIDSQWVA